MTTARPGGICSGVTGDGWVCVATGTIWYYWRSGTLLGPSRALAQRCAAGCASGVTARLSVVGRRSCRWRPGAAAASRAYSSPARAPAVNKRSREGDARTRPLNEARPSHRLDEALLASRVDSARQKPREAWEYLASHRPPPLYSVSGTAPVLPQSTMCCHKAPLAISRGGRSEVLGRSLCVIRVGIHQW